MGLLEDYMFMSLSEATETSTLGVSLSLGGQLCLPALKSRHRRGAESDAGTRWQQRQLITGCENARTFSESWSSASNERLEDQIVNVEHIVIIDAYNMFTILNLSIKETVHVCGIVCHARFQTLKSRAAAPPFDLELVGVSLQGVLWCST